MFIHCTVPCLFSSGLVTYIRVNMVAEKPNNFRAILQCSDTWYLYSFFYYASHLSQDLTNTVSAPSYPQLIINKAEHAVQSYVRCRINRLYYKHVKQC